jgi:hypothetical protein
MITDRRLYTAHRADVGPRADRTIGEAAVAVIPLGASDLADIRRAVSSVRGQLETLTVGETVDLYPLQGPAATITRTR